MRQRIERRKFDGGKLGTCSRRAFTVFQKDRLQPKGNADFT